MLTTTTRWICVPSFPSPVYQSSWRLRGNVYYPKYKQQILPGHCTGSRNIDTMKRSVDTLTTATWALLWMMCEIEWVSKIMKLYVIWKSLCVMNGFENLDVRFFKALRFMVRTILTIECVLQNEKIIVRKDVSPIGVCLIHRKEYSWASKCMHMKRVKEFLAKNEPDKKQSSRRCWLHRRCRESDCERCEEGSPDRNVSTCQ